MSKTKNKSKGQLVTEGLDRRQRLDAIEVTSHVVRQFQDAMTTFSTGNVGEAVNRSAPGLLMDPAAVLPSLQVMSPSQVASSRMDLLFALLDPSFHNALDGFQYLLASSKIDAQVELLQKFSAIDWYAISQPAFSENAGLMEKIQGFLYQSGQIREVKQADMKELVVLTSVPQFTQMLVLASGYAKVMTTAWKMFGDNRQFLDRTHAENLEIVSRLDSIVQRFSEAEERRLLSAQDVVQYTDDLQKALECASMLAELDNRAEEMLERINIDQKLVAAMGENTEQTVKSQLELIGEMAVSLHLLSKNQTRQANVTRAINSLSLYIKCYVVFEFLLTMLQVYMLTASTAIQTILAQNIQTAGARYGKEFYDEQIAPLEHVINEYVGTFRLPTHASGGEDIVESK